MAKIKLEKGNNYQINGSGDALEIRFNSKNKVYMQTLMGNMLSKKNVVALCDEEVRLFNGDTLRRSKTELTIN